MTYKNNEGKTSRSIILDFDDVIGDMSMIVEETLTHHTGQHKCRHTWDVYHIDAHFPITQEEFLQVIIDKQIYERMEPIPGSVEAVNILKDKGYFIDIVTARGAHPAALQVTKRWLDQHDVWWDSLSIIKFGESKSKVYQDIAPSFEYIVDDHLKNIDDAIQSGLVKTPVVITKAWNASDTRFVQGVNRFRDLKEFALSI